MNITTNLVENYSMMGGHVRFDPVGMQRAVDEMKERIATGSMPVVSHFGPTKAEIGTVGVVTEVVHDGGNVGVTMTINDSPLKDAIINGRNEVCPFVNGIYRHNTNELKMLEFQHVALLNESVDKIVTQGN